MRSLNRIDLFLNEIGKIWKEQCPDWRFGQLMFNFLSQESDPFHWEEEEFLERLKKFFKIEE